MSANSMTGNGGRVAGRCVSAVLAVFAAVSAAACTSSNDAYEPVAKSSAPLTLTLGNQGQQLTGQSGTWFASNTAGGSSWGQATYDTSTSVFELQSNGWGPAIRDATSNADGVEFAFKELAANTDIDVIVRIKSTSVSDPMADPSGLVQAGIMLRDGTCPGNTCGTLGQTVPMAATWFANGVHPGSACSGDQTGLSVFDTSSRYFANPNDLATLSIVAPNQPNATRLIAPVWLRIRRVGNDFSAMRRFEGGRWEPIMGAGVPRLFTGGEFAPVNGMLLGLFVSRPYTSFNGVHAIAQFDNLYVGPPLPLSDPGTGAASVTSTWVGSSSYRHSTGALAAGMNGYYVDPNGSSYKYTPRPEGGFGIDVLDAGGAVQRFAQPFNLFQGLLAGGITGDGTNVYVGTTVYGQSPPPLTIERLDATTLVSNKSIALPAGLSEQANRRVFMAARKITATASRLYLSDFDYDRIRIIDSDAGSEVGSISVTRPGPIAADSQGRLWVAQLTSYPDPSTWTFNQNSSSPILCYTISTGLPCTSNITVNGPTGLSVAPTSDTLLIALNNSTDSRPVAWNIPLNGSPTPAPALPTPPTGTFSALGAGKDSSGNLYVASSAPKMEIRKYSSTGVEQWSRFALGGVDEQGAFDPTPPACSPPSSSCPEHFYTLRDHFAFNPAVTVAGQEWTLQAHTWDPFTDDGGGTDPQTLEPRDLRKPFTLSDSQAPWIRHVGTDRYIFVPRFHHFAAYLTRQDYWESRITIYKITGTDEVAHLYGTVANDATGTQLRIWKQGYATEHVVSIPGGSFDLQFAANVDSRGDIWLAFNDFAASGCTSGSSAPECKRLWHIPFSLDDTQIEKYPPPAVPAGTSITWGKYFGVVPAYDFSTDSLYLLLGLNDETLSGQCGTGPTGTIGRFKRTSPSSPWQYVYVAKTFDPRRSAAENESLSLPDDPSCGCSSTWNPFGFDQAGEMLFLGERRGVVHAYRKSTGHEVASLFNGPEVDGLQNHTDGNYYRAVQRSNGEYLVSKTDSSVRAGELVFRWSWTPLELEPLAWYRADQLGNPAAATPIGTWPDLSGNHQDAIQINAGSRPKYYPNGLTTAGDKPTLRFDGSASFLYNQTWGTRPPNGAEAPFTVLAVYKRASTPLPHGGIASWFGVGGTIGARVNDTGAPVLYRQGVNQDNQSYAVGSLGVAPHVVVYRYDGAGTATIKVDGVGSPALLTPNAVSPIDGNNTQLLIGREDAFFNYYFKGDISELVIVGSAISDADAAHFLAYANTSWGL